MFEHIEKVSFWNLWFWCWIFYWCILKFHLWEFSIWGGPGFVQYHARSLHKWEIFYMMHCWFWSLNIIVHDVAIIWTNDALFSDTYIHHLVKMTEHVNGSVIMEPECCTTWIIYNDISMFNIFSWKAGWFSISCVSRIWQVPICVYISLSALLYLMSCLMS